MSIKSASDASSTDYLKLTKRLKRKKILYEDRTHLLITKDIPLTSFNPNNLLHSGDIKLLRPKEYCSSPELFIKDTENKVVIPGNINLASAALCLLLNQELWTNVVPDYVMQSEQWLEGNEVQYTGVVRFRLWQFSKWEDLLVDDRLPTVNQGHVLTCLGNHGDELWLPLLEKAMAKMYGGHDEMDGITIEEFLENLTGGISEVSFMSNTDVMPGPEAVSHWFTVLRGELASQSVVACGTYSSSEMENSGIWFKRLYGVTDTRDLEVTEGVVKRLVCVRDLWGQGIWSGPFSKSSTEWAELTQEQRDDLETGRLPDEFWMAVEDFCNIFEVFYVVRCCFEYSVWQENLAVSSWMDNRNPQFIFDIECPENWEEDVLIYLERMSTGNGVSKNCGIAINVYRVELNREIRMSDLSVQKFLGATAEFSFRRSALIHTRLRNSRYAVVPMHNMPSDFFCSLVVRIVTRQCVFFQEITQNKFHRRPIACCEGLNLFQPKMVTRVVLVSARNLVLSEKELPTAKYHCVMSCEGQAVRSREISFPEGNKAATLYWEDDAAIFYRNKPNNVAIRFEFFSDAPSHMGYYLHRHSFKEVTTAQVMLQNDLGEVTFMFMDVDGPALT